MKRKFLRLPVVRSVQDFQGLIFLITCALLLIGLTVVSVSELI